MIRRYDCNGAYGMQANPQGEYVRAEDYPTDRLGWICSMCYGWNHDRTLLCEHTHAEATTGNTEAKHGD